MVDAAWQAALAGAPYHLQHRIVADGEARWVEERAEIEFDGEHRPIKAVGTVQDITDRKAAETRIETLAFYDPLTVLPNRALFMDRLRHELAAAERRGQRLALLFLDLDRFKDINDTLGHDAGDEVLRLTGQALAQPWLASCRAARIGGDEFALIVDDPQLIADPDALRMRIEAALRVSVEAKGVTMTSAGSVGLATFAPDMHSLRDFARQADGALYAAKRNRVGRRIRLARDAA